MLNFNYKQSQFELFPGSPGSSSESLRPRYLFAHLTFSLENIVVLTIMMIMVVVFAFSLGVEKGKKIVKPSFVPPPSPTANRQPLPAGGPRPINTAALPTASKKTISEKIVPAGNSNNREENKIDQKAGPAVLPVTSGSLEALQPFTIQVASFKDETYAQKEAEVLKMKGFDAFVAVKGDYSIVCVGKFRKKDEMNLVMSQLRKKYSDCLARRL